MAYYREYNACGGRVKYRWGQKVDMAVADARALLLESVGKDPREYAVAFTPNTTYGINLVLHQLTEGSFARLITSEIEHNSVMVPAMAWTKKRGAPLSILPREAGGALRYGTNDVRNAVVIANTISNLDGRALTNAGQLANDVHAENGVLLLDAAQGFAHDRKALSHVDFDAAFGSGHKTYAPSVGFVIIRRSLLERLDPFFLGGGTVSDVGETGFDLLAGDDLHARLEPGLQDWGAIVGLTAALRWLEEQDPEKERGLTRSLWEGIAAMPRVRPLNAAASPIVSFSVDGIDAHKLAVLLGEQKIMCRSGHFCCHRYLHNGLGLPPLLRVSIGLHNTQADVDALLSTLRSILSVF